MKRYTTRSVGDMSKILGTRRHMKQYALAKGHTIHDAMWYFVQR